MADTLQSAVMAAQAGDKAALSQVVAQIEDQVFRLALRMLADRPAAEDATQDILVLIITKLSQYRGDSRFTTWVYRVAVNHLLSAKKIRAREAGLTFEAFAEDLEDGLADPDQVEASDHVMLNELRVACTMAMLLCLDLDHRIAYVLGRVLELSQAEALDILDLPPATYRKRLSRASAKVEAFTARRCGVVAPGKAACSCARRLPQALALGRVDAEAGLTGGVPGPDFAHVIDAVAQVEDGLKTLCAQRLMPEFSNPQRFALRLETLLRRPIGPRQ